MGRAIRLIVTIVLQNRIAYGDAFVANVGTWVIVGRGDELADYVLTLMTERTTQCVIGTCTFQGDLRRLGLLFYIYTDAH
jgi:hypothetical protein